MPDQIDSPAPDTTAKSEPQDTIYKYRSFFFSLQVIVFIIIAVGIILAFTAPQVLMSLLSLLWIGTICLVGLFLILGAMIMIGLRSQVKSILSVIMEGSLSIVDIVELIKQAIRNGVNLIQEGLLFLVPLFAYLFAFLLYLLILILFKVVGSRFDVSLLMIGLTAVLMIVLGFVNKSARSRKETGTWLSKFNKKFQKTFADAMEVAVFVLFLTVDSTSLFFLPASLNIELKANLFGYDLMQRGWDFAHGGEFTLTIITITVIFELIRYAMRIVVGGVYFYREINQYMGSTNSRFTTGDQIKHAIRQSFDANRDDVVKFITYFTILIAVFLAFPKLKLVSMATTSVVGLGLDLAFRDRMSVKRGEDLVSRIITRVFGV